MANDEHRPVSPSTREDDRHYDKALRPKSFAEYIGQRALVENLSVFVKAARMRVEAVHHILFCGPPGLGKTTLAHIIAAEMDSDIVASSGPAIERKGDLAGILDRALAPNPDDRYQSVHDLVDDIAAGFEDAEQLRQGLL